MFAATHILVISLSLSYRIFNSNYRTHKMFNV